MIDEIQKGVVAIVDIIQDAVDSETTNKHEKAQLHFYFAVFQKILKEHSATYKRKKDMQSSPFYVEPVPLSFGTKLVNKRKKFKQVVLAEPMIMYTIPIKKTVEALFKSKVFKEAFFHQKHNCQEGIYTNFCCGSKFQKEEQRTIRNTVIIQIYYDGVNLGKALKSKCNKNKVGTIYFRILNLAPELQSLHQNIHLVGIFNENDVKKCPNKYNAIWKLVADEINEAENAKLQIDGIEISIAVMQGAADNLGFHQMSGV